MMLKITCREALLFAFLFLFSTYISAQQNTVSQWTTTSDRSMLFEPARNTMAFSTGQAGSLKIEVDDSKTFQPMDGFGYALTGGSAMHMIRMSAPARAKLIKELFDTTGDNIGVSYIRLSIGASDLNEKIYSYNDLPEGQTDTAMEKFDLGDDRADVIPVMKEILKVAPNIPVMGSPWSPPTWMKNNNDTRGGRLKPEYYPAYAKYFVKYVQQMKEEGITIDAITIQNEPLHPGNNPSLLMTAPEQAEFVRDHLGPAFERAGIKTKIIVYDHNANRPDYPIRIYRDSAAAKYIDGSAFHLYAGSIEALTDVHEAFPDKRIYFTEQMVVQRASDTTLRINSPVRRLIIGAPRNWSRIVLLWNLAADPENKPFTDRGGCPMCQGAVTIDKDSVTRNLAYYTIAHASKFVRPGSLRIQSSSLDSLPNVAFKTPGGRYVLIVSNDAGKPVSFDIVFRNKKVRTTMQAKSVSTFVW